MKALQIIGDLITALSIVMLLFLIAEIAIGWRMIPDGIMIPGFIIALFLLLVGIILRSIVKKEGVSKK